MSGPQSADPRPLLSVVMPAFNAARFIDESLDSLANQSFRDFEVIVVNDGSTDTTGEILDRWARPTSPESPHFIVINQDNRGPSAARNVALRTARGRYVAFLDADDRWSFRKAERHLEILANRPEIDLTFSWFRFIDEHGRDLIQTFAPQVPNLSTADLLCQNVIHTGTVVARREAIECAGPFDETLKAFEDWDLWLRVSQLRPGNMHCLEEILTDYRRRPGQITSDWRIMTESWQKVFDRYLRSIPHIAEPIADLARGNHLEYCASLAYNAGDNAQSRLLMRAAWRAAGIQLIRRPSALLMTAVGITTLLPRPLQRVLGRTYKYMKIPVHWARDGFGESKPAAPAK